MLRTGFVLAALLLAGPPCAASELVTRAWTVEDGLPVNHATALAQDREGYLWAATAAGLARFDGTSFEVMGRGIVRAEVHRLLADPEGGVVVLQSGGAVHRARDRGVVPVHGPDGAPLRARDLRVHAGRLVAATGEGLVRRGPDGWERLHEVVADVLGEHPDGRLVYAAEGGWWALDAGGEVERLADGRRPVAAEPGPRGALWLVGRAPATVRELRDGVETLHFSDGYRHVHDVVPTEDRIWIGQPHALTALDPATGTRESWSLGRGEGGLDLLHDREGALWLATFDGVVHVPEPSLRRFGRADGLPSPVTRYLARHGASVWVSTWQGAGHIDEDDQVTPLDINGLKGPLCSDGEGLWTFATLDHDLGRLRFRAYDLAGNKVREDLGPRAVTHLTACAPASPGGLWLLAGGRLYRTHGLDQAPELVGAVPLRRSAYHVVEEAPDGTLWAAAGRSVCRRPVATLGADEAGWRCLELPGPARIVDLAVTSTGALWIATKGDGVLRLDGEGVTALPGNEHLPSTDLRGLAPSPRGGVWVVGTGGGWRVEDAPGTEAGWRVLERLPAWLSARVSSVKDVLEEDDGTLWLATHDGVMRLPARARQPRPPSRTWVEAVRVLGVLQDLPADGAPPVLQLPGTEASLSVRVSARSFHAPHAVRYRHRLDGGVWSEPSADPVVELVGLAPGPHRLEIATAADGRSWGEPAALQVQVATPWWRRWWVPALGIGVLAGLALAVQRTLAGLRLREARARTRIAMDVHDELGAGLASLGLMGAMVERSEDPERARDLGARIAHDAGELGEVVSGIVWSLRPEHDSLGDLLDFLEARCASLLPGLHATGAVEVDPSGAASVPRLAPDRLRTLQQIATEALTNIARHARASSVRIGVQTQDGRPALVIRDDGVGFDPTAPSPRPGGGLGLRSMARRAREAGMEVQVSSAPGQGTRVAVLLSRGHPIRRRRVEGA